QTGDGALRTIAFKLRDSLDREAILARLYGATFAILHRGKSAEDILGSIQAAGEKVRNLDLEGASGLAAGGLQVRFHARDFSPDVAKDGNEFLLKVESELQSL
ncbi:MAG: diguanylate cyclase, partial [bacterium]